MVVNLKRMGIIALILLIVLGTGIVSGERVAEYKFVTKGGGGEKDSGLSTTDLTILTPEDLVDTIICGGVIVENVQYSGVNISGGTFTGGTGIIGFEDGIILSSGDVANVIGPNVADAITADNGGSGDADLQGLIPGYTTYDATVLEFDFYPTTDVITFNFVFTSDEYNEWVNSDFNDVFGFFLNGNNIALVPGTTTPVSVNNVNNGDPYNTDPRSYPEYYINNDLSDGGGAINTEMDGLTVVFSAVANVNAGEKNHIKLAIADAGDRILDSNVFIEGCSFVSPELTLKPINATNCIGSTHTVTATLFDETGSPVPGVEITFEIADGPHAGLTGTDVTDDAGEATFSYVGTTAGKDTIIAYSEDQKSNPAYKTWTICVPEFPTLLIPLGIISGLAVLGIYFRKKH